MCKRGREWGRGPTVMTGTSFRREDTPHPSKRSWRTGTERSWHTSVDIMKPVFTEQWDWTITASSAWVLANYSEEYNTLCKNLSNTEWFNWETWLILQDFRSAGNITTKRFLSGDHHVHCEVQIHSGTRGSSFVANHPNPWKCHELKKLFTIFQIIGIKRL